jgi:hypothetical protein
MLCLICNYVVWLFPTPLVSLFLRNFHMVSGFIVCLSLAISATVCGPMSKWLYLMFFSLPFLLLVHFSLRVILFIFILYFTKRLRDYLHVAFVIVMHFWHIYFEKGRVCSKYHPPSGWCDVCLFPGGKKLYFNNYDLSPSLLDYCLFYLDR